jgi:hypothetical protein
MRKPGWDPRRRNRNIGTPKAGRGRDTRFTIPEPWSDTRLYYERLVNPIELKRV